MKKNKVIFWATTVFLFLLEGVMPLSSLVFAPEYFNAGTKPLSYPDYFAYTLIIFKVVGATTIMIPKLPGKIIELAYTGLAFNLLFATISHLAVDGPRFVSFFPLIVLAILIISYLYNLKIDKPWLRQTTKQSMNTTMSSQKTSKIECNPSVR